MKIELNIHFLKQTDNKKEEWKSTFTTYIDNSFIENIQALMIDLQNTIPEIKKIPTFNGFLKLIFVKKFYKNLKYHENKLTIRSINELAKNNFINLEYLLKFNWSKLNKITVSKILTTNLYGLIYDLQQNEKNIILNLSKLYTNDAEEVFITNFKSPELQIVEKIDTQKIKSYIYKTPVKYKNK
jgi:hypothetical protein